MVKAWTITPMEGSQASLSTVLVIQYHKTGTISLHHYTTIQEVLCMHPDVNEERYL